MKHSDSASLLNKPTVRIKVVDTRTPSVNDPGTASRPLSQTFPKWWKVATLWFRGEREQCSGPGQAQVAVIHAACMPVGDEKRKAWTYAAVSVMLCLLNTLLLVRVSYAQRMFETALAGKQEGAHHCNHVCQLHRNLFFRGIATSLSFEYCLSTAARYM